MATDTRTLHNYLISLQNNVQPTENDYVLVVRAGELRLASFEDDGTIPGEDLYEVSFVVKDENDSPIAGAGVNFKGERTLLTDSDGKAVRKFPNGTYQYFVYKTGYTTRSGIFTVQNSTPTINVTMKSEGGDANTAKLYFIDFATESEITNPTGTIIYRAGPPGATEYEVSITGQGMEITGLAEFHYTFEISVDGYFDNTLSNKLISGTTVLHSTHVAVDADPRYDISFRIMAPAGTFFLGSGNVVLVSEHGHLKQKHFDPDGPEITLTFQNNTGGNDYSWYVNSDKLHWHDHNGEIVNLGADEHIQVQFSMFPPDFDKSDSIIELEDGMIQIASGSENVEADLPDPSTVKGRRPIFRNNLDEPFAMTINNSTGGTVEGEDIYIDSGSPTTQITSAATGEWVMMGTDGTDWYIISHYGNWRPS